jgi:predicted membrane protein
MHHFVSEGYVLPNQMHSYWTTMIVLYPYITGIVAGAFIISSLHHVFGKLELQPVSRFAMLMALAFLLFAPLPLLRHLGHPERAFNIMFTPNPTSAMAGFGFVYTIYLLILAVEIWLVYRDRFSEAARTRIGFVAGLLLLVQVAAMRWNVIMGGQMFSKSFRGFLTLHVDVVGREGLLAVGLLLAAPFVTLLVFSRILPLWGSVATFPKRWLLEAPPAHGLLKDFSRFE